jgi:hypothetical protein
VRWYIKKEKTMSKMTRTNPTQYFCSTLLGLGAALAGCGKSSSKSDSAPAPTIETSLASESQSADQVVVGFSSNIATASYVCRTDIIDQGGRQTQGQWAACAANGLTIPLPAGSKVTLSVKAVSPDGREDATPITKTYESAKSPANQNPVPQPQPTKLPDQISTNPRIPSQPGQGSLPPLEISSLNLGSAWTFQVPQGMHVLQYAANYGLGQGIDVLQIMQGQDPNYFSFYPGQFRSLSGCSALASQPVGIQSPAGNTLEYCAGKVQSAGDIARLFGFQYAPDHIEVGSDANAPVQSRMIVQVYQNYQQGMGILNGLCGGAANVSGFTEVFGALPVMNDFWAFSYLNDKVKTCRVTLNGLNGGRWQVAGFVFTENDYVANYCHNGCGGGSGRALEVLYLERNQDGMTRYSDYFARDFQSLIFNVLGRENPYMPF